MSEIDDKYVVKFLDKLRRGPGGHWHRYEARTNPDNGLRGYGETVRDAIFDLKAQEK